MAEKPQIDEKQTAEQPVLDGGTYEIIRGRLAAHGKDLHERMEKLNGARKEVFGSIDAKLLGTERITTDNNCIPRDMVPINSHFIFGYNVHIGLKTTTALADVFAIYRYENHQFQSEPLDMIRDEQFEIDFDNLYKYYKQSRFVKFSVLGPHLFMVFQVGKRTADIKVFKWLIDDGKLRYIDNRSEHEFRFPDQHEFAWQRTNRDFHRSGEHPHISIEDRIFVETVGGDLTIKIEDNTDSGEGIYAEDVSEKEQSLDDAEIFYGTVGSIIILKIKPYQEETFRYIIYNEKVQKARRIDAIEDACILLPDSHGLIFPNGYYLQSGEYKTFDHNLQNMIFEKQIISPNGEDYLYVFHNRELGSYVLLSYNLISQQVDIPVICNGFAFFDSGELVYCRAEEDPGKHHVVQIWQTPYVESDFAPSVHKDTYLYKIGNKDIVRGMAECQEIFNLIQREDSYANLYHDLVRKSRDVIDSYFWLGDESTFQMKVPLEAIHAAANSALDEFDKVLQLRKNTAAALAAAEKKADKLLSQAKRGRFDRVDEYVALLSELRTARGEIISLKDLRYIDLARVEELETGIQESNEVVSAACVEFLLKPESLQIYEEKVDEQHKAIDSVKKGSEAKELGEKISQTGSDLELLIEIVTNLKIDDPTQTTQIVDSISDIYTRLNQTRALLKKRQKDLRGSEAIAEFNSQIKLLGQGVINFLELCDTPEKCDEYLTRLMVQLEELESKFIDFDDFTVQLSEKREEIYSAFEARRLNLIESRNRRASSLVEAAERILKGIERRAGTLETVSEINGYFASDLMIDKVRDIIQELVALDDNVKADDVQTRLKTAQEDAVRQLKDRQDLFVDGQNIIKFGKHQFSVNVQPLDLTVLPREDEMVFHLTGTNFFEAIDDAEFNTTQSVWQQEIVSENNDVARSEFLAFQMLQASLGGELQLPAELQKLSEAEMAERVRTFMAPRFQEGYTKGVHDSDAAKLLRLLINVHQSAGLLRFGPSIRACATLYWEAFADAASKENLLANIDGMGAIIELFPASREWKRYVAQLETEIITFLDATKLFPVDIAGQAAEYLFYQLINDGPWITSKIATDLYTAFHDFLKKKKGVQRFEDSVRKLGKDPLGRFHLIRNWVSAFVNSNGQADRRSYLDEAAVALFRGKVDKRGIKSADVNQSVEGMLSEHRTTASGSYEFRYHAFVEKMRHYMAETAPMFQRFTELKHQLTEDFRAELRLDAFKPRVLTSFVRNQLLDKVYLPLIGDNLAKQLGTAGDQTRTDRMGLLLLISPPGYGKTTLMEYVANRLGIIFVKVNGPAIGHHVTSLDPQEAPNASAREEIEKLNLALEMGDNVMIYLDDIQHCNPELLQKFIPLCDAQRRIEGVYKGKSKTYDLRGRKVCVVMAGNPYTESGEKFQIPDMLSNRADTYNLGDILGDNRDVFELSYLENCLTSNAVLGKLVSRSQKDIYEMIRLAQYGDQDGASFEHNYSVEELNEIVSVLKKLIRVRDVILSVNQQYIESAAQADEYRTEPAFKLQGSYRNMNKIAEKILPIMNDEELETLLLSHYEQEAQILTSDAEANLLKFKELSGRIAEEETERWEEIKKTFRKNLSLGGVASGDRMGQFLAQFMAFNEGLDGIRETIESTMRESRTLVLKQSKRSAAKKTTASKKAAPEKAESPQPPAAKPAKKTPARPRRKPATKKRKE